MRFLMLFFLFPLFSSAQNDFSIAAYRHTVHHGDYNATFQVSEAKEPKMDLNKNYYWYSNNAVKITQGAYAGKLLDGMYIASYANGNLKEKGVFGLGLKDGEWKSWNENGVLLNNRVYRKGVLHGSFINFEAGKPKESGNYKNGKLHGALKVYGQKDSIQVSRYKEGKMIMAKPKKNWFKKILKKQKK